MDRIVLVLTMGLVLTLFSDRLYAQTEKPMDTMTLKAFPLDQELAHNDYDVQLWTIAAVKDTLTFGPENWRQKLEFSSRYFTNDGWQDFVKWMQASSMLPWIEANRRDVEVAIGSLKEWEKYAHVDKSVLYLEFPVEIVFSPADREMKSNAIVRVTVKSEKSELGLYPQIASWESRSSSDEDN